MQYLKICATLLIALLFTACGSVSYLGLHHPGTGQEIRPIRDVEGQPPVEQRIVYFDFNRADIRADAIPVLDANADFLLETMKKNSNLQIVIEGHADTIGSEEYNVVLGNRRAEAVSRYLRNRGVPPANIRTLSFGESRPVVLSSGQEDLARDRSRRVVLVYSP